MSTSSRRRQRLEVARSLPAMRCPGCGVLLERLFVPVSVHAKRCDTRLAKEERQLQEAIG